MTGTGAAGRFLVVGAICAALSNAIIVGFDWVGVHFAVSALISFAVVVPVAYGLHTSFTFSARRGPTNFLLFGAAMAANYPLLIIVLFVLVDLVHLPVMIAAPIATVALFGWNFFASRWAIARAPIPQTEPATQLPEEDTVGAEISG